MTARKTAAVADDPTKTYEIETSRGAVRIDIPESFKVTFGPIIGAGGGNKFGGSALAFRVWESDTKQRLLITDVVSFRDISIPMLRRAVRKFGSEEWSIDDGSWTGKRSEQVEKTWKPIDDPEVGIDTKKDPS